MSGRLTVAIAVPAGEAEKRYANYFGTLRALGALPVPAGADVRPGDFAGLLLPGGGDIDPARYGRANTASRGVDPALDELQLGALDAFVRAGTPVFGICRGHQLVNVYFGGTLIQHIPQAMAHSWTESGEDRAHDSVAKPGSALERLYGRAFWVNSAHHQAVERLGEGLRAIQESTDGVIEAMIHGSLPVFSVQWHPERMCLERSRADTVDGGAVIRAFLGMCADRAG